MMALRITGRNKVIVDDSVNPIYRMMLHSLHAQPRIELDETPLRGRPGRTAPQILDRLDDKTGGRHRAEPELLRLHRRLHATSPRRPTRRGRC